MKTTTAKKAPNKRPALAKPSTAGLRLEFPVDASLRKLIDRAARQKRVPRSQLIVEMLRTNLGASSGKTTAR